MVGLANSEIRPYSTQVQTLVFPRALPLACARVWVELPWLVYVAQPLGLVIGSACDLRMHGIGENMAQYEAA